MSARDPPTWESQDASLLIAQKPGDTYRQQGIFPQVCTAWDSLSLPWTLLLAGTCSLGLGFQLLW